MRVFTEIVAMSIVYQYHDDDGPFFYGTVVAKTKRFRLKIPMAYKTRP